MGWLLDRMEMLRPPATSFSELAKRLKQRNPSLRGAPVPASVATYLGQLDNGNAAPLRRHPKVWVALAELLGLSPDELEALSSPGASGGRRQSDARLELWDVDVQPLDLSEEPLPPGIPLEVQDPRGWPFWWVAPSGSGRTLVGRWLEARGLATFVQARTWTEAQGRLPPRGAVFVELTAGARDDVPSTPRSRSICIAAGWRPPKPPDRGPFTGDEEPAAEGWPLVECAPVEDWLEALVTWLEERLDPEDIFDRAACLRWLREDEWPKRVIDGFGTVLGLAGLFAKSGPRGVQAGRARLMRDFLRLRLNRLSSEGQVAPLKELSKGLPRIGRGLLLDGAREAEAGRPVDEWYALARGEGPDAGWLREVQTRGWELHTLQRMSQHLPPDAYAVVSSLRTLQLLRETSSAEFAIRPDWFLDALLEEGARTLVGEEPRNWGAALLHPPGAYYVVDALLTRFLASDFELLPTLLRTPAPDAPEWVAALEGTFLALGLVLLESANAPLELVREVYEWQRRLLLEGQEQPGGERDLLSRRVLVGRHHLSQGLWYLAALRLSEYLGPEVALLHPDLDPRARVPSMDAARAQNEAWEALQTPGVTRWRPHALDLGGRMWRHGEQRTPVSLLQFNEYLLQAFRRGTLDWWPKVPWRVFLLELPSYLERHGQSWAPLAEALWKAWLASSSDFPNAFHPRHPWADALWKALPPEVVEDARLEHLLSAPEVPYGNFGPSHWRAFHQLWRNKRRDFVFLEKGWIHPWSHIPREHAHDALIQGVLGLNERDARAELWRRFPELALEELRTYLLRADWQKACVLVSNAPDEQAAEMLELLVRTVLEREATPPEWLLRLLRAQVTARGVSWRKAWEWFVRLVPAKSN